MIQVTGWNMDMKKADPRSVYLLNRDHIVMVRDHKGYSMVLMSDGSQLYVTNPIDTFK